MNANQNLDSEKCESVEEDDMEDGGIKLNENKKLMISWLKGVMIVANVVAVGNEVWIQNKMDMKFCDCKVTAVREGKCKVHLKGWKA